MSMDDVKKKLTTQFGEEIEDSNMYYDLACHAKDDCHNKNLAMGLYEISKDEYTHAKFIHDFMVTNGICVPEELKCKWETLVRKAHKVYPDVPKCMYDI